MVKFATTATELAMLIDWVLAAALVLDLISIDPSMMYSDYQNPLVVAWNWSFFPIDIAFAIIGLTARFGVKAARVRFKLEVIAGVLMFCAGLMAVSFWTITGDFDPTWWGMNIWLIVLGGINVIRAELPSTCLLYTSPSPRD